MSDKVQDQDSAETFAETKRHRSLRYAVVWCAILLSVNSWWLLEGFNHQALIASRGVLIWTAFYVGMLSLTLWNLASKQLDWRITLTFLICTILDAFLDSGFLPSYLPSGTDNPGVLFYRASVPFKIISLGILLRAIQTEIRLLKDRK